ncbi:MAG: class I SAM-dependent methyltransferase [Pseudomonadota bacterium]|nr:class I SAM-dependent methyltransferase [Pseudomonadota bacterium]
MQKKDESDISIDFVSLYKKLKKQNAFSKTQLLAKAIGFKGRALKIIDATAGLGRDSLFFLGLGCEVMAIERSPVIFELLSDAVQRAKSDEKLGPLFLRFKLVLGDASEILKNLPEQEFPDVVYLDPMYPHRTKSALPKKEMIILKDIVGEDLGSTNLLALSIKCSKGRVVVKRPPKGKPLAELMNHSFKGKSVRYDMYLSHFKQNGVGCEKV